MNLNKGNVWLFDVCGTLYRSNTTYDFLTYFFERNSTESFLKLRNVTNKSSVIYWLRAVVYRFFGIDLHKKAAVALLKGFELNAVEKEAENFLDEFLATREIEATQQLLTKQIELNRNPVLVSNSLSPIIKAIGQKLNLDFIATTLAVVDGKLTGSIERDLFGQKHKYLGDFKEQSLTVVTDNKSDKRLVKMANERIVVVYSQSDRKFWSKLNPTFIQV